MDAAHAAHAHDTAGAVLGDGSGLGIGQHELAHAQHKHGSWGGHVLPGALFVVLGCWWLLAAAASFHQQRRATFRAQPWWSPLALAELASSPRTAARFKGLVLLEPVLLTVLPLVGVAVELFFHPGDLWWRAAVTADGERFDFENLNNWQHAAMYAAFAFCGACALALAQPWARSVGFAALVQAFAIELMLFWFHLRMQSGLSADVHVLLCFAVGGCAVSVFAEGLLSDSGAIVPTLARSFFTILQGTWFCQAAHILYGSKPWSADDMGNSMMLPVVFSAHVLGGARPHLSLHAVPLIDANHSVYCCPRHLRGRWASTRAPTRRSCARHSAEAELTE